MRLLAHHFGEDAADAPDVDGHQVDLAAEQDLRGAVPERHHLVRVGARRDAERARQAEIRQLQPTCGTRSRRPSGYWQDTGY